jgi:Domain of unknown function (DUF3786)
MLESSAYEETYQSYLSQIAAIDLHERAERLGGEIHGAGIVVPYFGKPYSISSTDICDLSGNKASFAVRVALSKYVLMCPEVCPSGAEWASYRDFKDAAPFASAFAKNAEKALSDYFSEHARDLDAACHRLACRPPNVEVNYDVARIIDALPKVPVFLLFNDADEEFAASCSILFEKRAEHYLDMECLAIVGWHLADYLKFIAGGASATLI